MLPRLTKTSTQVVIVATSQGQFLGTKQYTIYIPEIHEKVRRSCYLNNIHEEFLGQTNLFPQHPPKNDDCNLSQ